MNKIEKLKNKIYKMSYDPLFSYSKFIKYLERLNLNNIEKQELLDYYDELIESEMEMFRCHILAKFNNGIIITKKESDTNE